ncbi:TetR/AcrR family transcriptional regulator [Gordonia sp. DT30]|uniref:TetR/AcrR family transcriptional regulator n=1 Tax=unclassified Gordonia (in: high G+C Gram-positive bacteria) TaxID=2657482 RepID=UPI003CEC4EE9
MAFTTKGLATRARIVDEVATYLRSNDPGGVTLDDVRAVTQTSKSQLFHYFPGGKEQLWLEVAHREADRVLDDQQPYLSALDSWEAWDQWRSVLIERYRAQGPQCPLAALTSQLGSGPGTAEVATALLRRWQSYVRRGIVSMQDAALVRPDLDAERLAAAFIAGIQGGVTVLRTTGDTAHLEAVLGVMFDHLRSG